MTDILFLELLEAHPGPLAEPIEVGIPVRPGEGVVETEAMSDLEDHVPVVPRLADLGELLSGEDAPYLVHEDDVVLLEPVGGGQHEIGELGGGRHEHIGDDRVFHVVLQCPLDREPLGGRQERVGADDPHGAHPVGLARYHRFPERRRDGSRA